MTIVSGNFTQPAIKSPGIHFDPIGSLKLIDGHLSVIIPIDISFIKPHIENLNGVIGTSRYLCKQSNAFDELECHNLLQPLSVRYYDIVRDFESISHLIEFRSKRSAWFGGIGTVFKHLFGTMNEDDAIKYSNAIQSVENDQIRLSELMKENILVTKSTLSSYKNIINDLGNNEKILNSAVENLSNKLKNLTLLTDKIIIKSNINEMFNMLESSLLTLSFKLEDIVNGIMFSKSNILHPSIITPKLLFSELVDNYRFLPNFRQFPVSLSLENIYILLNISELATFYNKNKIVFVLKVPLVTSNEFSLYNCIPFPVLNKFENKTYSTIIPSTKYIGITRDRALYCKLSSLHSCKIIYDMFYVCELLNVYSTSANAICESEIISKALNSVPKQCEINFFQGDIEIWERLNNNKWIYVISEKSKLSITCQKSGDNEINIIGTGILNLPIDCIAYYKDLILIPKSTKTIEIQTVNSTFDLLNDKCCDVIKLNSIENNIPNLTLKNINLDSISAEHNKATSQMVKHLDKIIEKPHIVLYGQYYSYSTICILIIVLLIISLLIYKYCKGKCQRVFKMKSKGSAQINNIELEIVETPKVQAARIKPT